jgi:hypothetical protein
MKNDIQDISIFKLLDKYKKLPLLRISVTLGIVSLFTLLMLIMLIKTCTLDENVYIYGTVDPSDPSIILFSVSEFYSKKVHLGQKVKIRFSRAANQDDRYAYAQIINLERRNAITEYIMTVSLTSESDNKQDNRSYSLVEVVLPVAKKPLYEYIVNHENK